MTQMIIANRLRDGLVVFLAESGGWVESIDDGLAVDDGARAEQLLAQAKADEDECIVIDPNLIEVSHDTGRWVPTSYREAIRAFGPSVRTELLEASRE